jgi:hypothetical protein
MDEPTVDTSAALAKRLQHNHTVSIIPAEPRPSWARISPPRSRPRVCRGRGGLSGTVPDFSTMTRSWSST